jgi:myo-inositol-1(or 4)-monophosphatase
LWSTTESPAPIVADALPGADALAIASGAARLAGAILVERFRGPASGIRAKSSSTDLVSEADERAERAIVEYIGKYRADDALVAEEGSTTTGRSGIRWYVDPLDGTINYLYGIPHWAVTICCADQSGPLAGVVYEPLRGELFEAMRGGGAACGGRALAVTKKSDLSTALVATGFAYVAESRERQGRLVGQILGAVRDIRRAGAASLDLAFVAAGRLDGYFESVDKPWDWMAGALLVREAAGRVTQLHPSDPALPHIVASGGGIHDGLLALLDGAADQL